MVSSDCCGAPKGEASGTESFAGQLDARLTCPSCGHVTRATMPENACLYFFNCPACGKGLTPLAGDCCVFCSYADVPCPPRQGKEVAARPR